MIRCRIQGHTVDVHNCQLMLDKYYSLIIHDDSKYTIGRLVRDFGMDCRLSKLRDECGIIYLPKGHQRPDVV